MMSMDWKNLQRKIRIKFADKSLLISAFVHRSILNESRRYTQSNERLEFLGDSVLHFIIAEYLYRNFPELDEGKATDIRSALVSGEALANAARRLGIGNFLILSRGEEKAGGRDNSTLLADAVEALIGAVYLDQGIDKTREFVIEFVIKPFLPQVLSRKSFASPKSELQKLTQKKFRVLPEYRLLSESGPDHSKEYRIGVFVDGRKISEAAGKSKRKAETKAAETALYKLQSDKS